MQFAFMWTVNNLKQIGLIFSSVRVYGSQIFGIRDRKLVRHTPSMRLHMSHVVSVRTSSAVAWRTYTIKRSSEWFTRHYRMHICHYWRDFWSFTCIAGFIRVSRRLSYHKISWLVMMSVRCQSKLLFFIDLKLVLILLNYNEHRQSAKLFKMTFDVDQWRSPIKRPPNGVYIRLSNRQESLAILSCWKVISMRSWDECQASYASPYPLSSWATVWFRSCWYRHTSWRYQQEVVTSKSQLRLYSEVNRKPVRLNWARRDEVYRFKLKDQPSRGCRSSDEAGERWAAISSAHYNAWYQKVRFSPTRLRIRQ